MVYRDDLSLCEFAIFGAAMLDPAYVPLILAELTRDDFSADNALVYDAVQRLDARGAEIDLVTLSAEMDKGGAYSPTPWSARLAEMTGYYYTPENIVAYIEQLQDRRRRVESVGGLVEVIKAAKSGEEYTDRLLEIANGAVRRTATKTRFLDTSIMRSVDALGEKFAGVSTGYPDIDTFCGGGFTGGQLIILAARTSQGKTSLAMNMAANVAATKKVVAVYEMEMSRAELEQRLLASIAGVTLYEAKAAGSGGDMAREKMKRAAQRLTAYTMAINDSSSETVAKIKADALKIKQQNGLSLVVVDYLGQVKAPQRKGGTREQEVAELTRGLKEMARELDCAVLVLVQLNRNIEHRGADARPQLSDLRESGAIEQDADIVMLLKLGADGKSATLRIEKNRSGKTGSVNLVWQGEYFTFRSAYNG